MWCDHKNAQVEQELSGQRTHGQDGGVSREGTNERKQGEAILGLNDLVTFIFLLNMILYS